MKQCLFTSLFICLLTSLSGQETKTYHIDELNLYIDSFPFCINSVIDARLDKSAIGMYTKGMQKHQILGVTKNSLTDELGEVFYRFFDCKGNDSKPISVRINKFYFYEVSKVDKGSTSFQISLTFLEKVDSGYVELCTIGRNIGAPMDGSGKKNDKMKAFETGLRQCFIALWNRSKKGTFHNKFLPNSDLHELPIPNVSTVRPRGVYLTHTDFLEGIPRTGKTYNFAIQEDPYSTSSYDTYLVGWRAREMRSIAVWGVSDGTTDYMNILGKFYPIKKSDGKLHVMAPRRKTSDDSNIMALGGMFGLAGVVLALALDDKSTIELDENYPAIYNVDPWTGGIEEVNCELKKGSYILLFVENDSDLAFTISIDDKEVCTITKDTYIIIPSTSSFKKYHLEVDLAGVKKSISFMPQLSTNSLFEISAKKTKPKIKSVKRKSEALYFEKVNSGWLKKGCPEK